MQASATSAAAQRRIGCLRTHLSTSLSPAAADPDAEDLYDVLGVARDASESDIRKAYRRAAVKHHPDKGGDEKAFQAISRAHEVLSDGEKRQIYDQFGMQGLEQHEQGEAAGGGAGPGSSDPFSVFESMFGGAFGTRDQTGGTPRQRDQTFELSCTLNDAYNGKNYRVQFDRKAPCAQCTGTGVQEGHTRQTASIECNVCSGSGQTIRSQRTLFGVQRVQSTCNACGGQGSVLDPNLLCGVCAGQGLQRQRHSLEVTLPRGVEDGETIVVSEQGDYSIQAGRAADVVFITRVKEHPMFTRHGSHLLLKQKVTLAEALGGMQLLLSHLDGRRLLVKTGAGECLAPGALRVVEGEGMPNRDGASVAHCLGCFLRTIVHPGSHGLSR